MKAYKVFLFCVAITIFSSNAYSLPSMDGNDFDCCTPNEITDKEPQLRRCYGKILTDRDGEESHLKLGFDIRTQFNLSKTYFLYRIPPDRQYNRIPAPPPLADLTQWIVIEYDKKVEYYLLLLSEKGESYTIFSKEHPCIIEAAQIDERKPNAKESKSAWYNSGVGAIMIALILGLGGTPDQAPSSDGDPSILNTTPSNHSNTVSERLQIVTIHFSQPMDDGSGVILVDTAEWQIPERATKEWSNAATVLTLSRQDDTAIERGKIITFTLEGFMTADGQMMQPYSLSFQIN